MIFRKTYAARVMGLILLGFILPQGSVRAASTLKPGNIALLRECPGDKVNIVKRDPDPEKILGIIPALLTPLITSGVDTILKSAGAKLTKSAQEMQADLLHQGSYFYQTYQFEIPDPALQGAKIQEIGWDQKSWCIVVASRSTEVTEQTVQQLVSSYKSYEIKFDLDTRKRTHVSPKNSGSSDLTAVLSELGFSDKTTPGIVAVFDIEVSEQGTSFRLIPRFVTMDHSIREGKVDERARDISFEFTFAVPSNTPVKTDPLIKIEGLKIGEPYINNSTKEPKIVSHWISRPSNDGTGPKEEATEDNNFTVGQRGRTFDLTIQVKEFRKRPIAAFFGGVLSNDETRAQIAQPIVSAINPESIIERRAQEAAAQTALLTELSSLIDTVRVKQRALKAIESTGTPAEIEAAQDELLAAKRAANLKAREAGLDNPYSDAGFFRLTP